MKKLTIILLIILTSCAMITENRRYEWYPSGNAPKLYPTELFYGDFIFSDGNSVYISESVPFASMWGQAGGTHILDNNFFPAPSAIDIIWFSLVENQFYELKADLPKEKIAELMAEMNEKTYYDIIVGMAPYGRLAIWVGGNGIKTELAWLQAKPTDVEWEKFAPHAYAERKEYVEDALKDRLEAYENFKKNGFPDTMLFENYMQKFNYRITPKFEDEKVVIRYINFYYYNGELNTDNSGEHLSNAMRGKPLKIILSWNIGKDKYDGYFWTDKNKIIETFANFYNDDPQKEGNLVIEIGKSNNKIKFSLQNDTTTVEIPEEEMEIIVFKDDWEFFKSKSYNRAEGGWRDF